MAKIILEIRMDGSVGYEMTGTKGNVCTKKSGWLDQLLAPFGIKKRVFKKEYHEHSCIIESTK